MPHQEPGGSRARLGGIQAGVLLAGGGGVSAAPTHLPGDRAALSGGRAMLLLTCLRVGGVLRGAGCTGCVLYVRCVVRLTYVTMYVWYAWGTVVPLWH